MIAIEERAYSKYDAGLVAAFTTASRLREAAVARIVADARAFPHVKGAATFNSVLEGVPRITGLVTDDPSAPPAGWRYVQRRRRLEPERGPAGQDARRWLSDHQIPPEANGRGLLAAAGLPLYVEHGGDQITISWPRVEVVGGVLWALYRAEPKNCSWQRRRVSEFYAALESTTEVA